jgi:hypothetical protein
MRVSLRIRPARWVGLMVLWVVLGAVGCGSSSTGTVSGKVTYKGAPLKGGTVTFVNKQQSSLAEIQEDGSYKAEKVPTGDATISVETTSLKPPNQMAMKNRPPAGAQGGPKMPDYEARAKRYIQIPDKYSDAQQSGLKYTVKSGSQEFEIKLE